MKKLKLFFALFAMLALNVGNAWGAESLQVTLDFTTNSWNLPTSKVVEEQSFTSGSYTIKVKGTSGNGYQFNSQKYLIMGKSGATLTLPAFDFNTTKIVVTGRSGASSSVQQNIYVGSTAVSTTTSGATGTNTYAIEEDYQAAGNVYVLKVTSNANTQITKIEVYGESNSTEPPTPATQYTIKWHTAKGVTTDVTLNEGATITKPETDPAMTGYEFMGWTASCDVALDGSDFTALTDFGTADSDKDFYAVFAVATTTGGGGSSNYEKVTSGLTDWAGDYLIAYDNTTFADGRIGGTGTGAMGASGVKVDLSSSISNNTIPASVGDQYNVTLEAVSGGYVLKTKDGNYNYQSSNKNGLTATTNISTATSYAIIVTFTSENDIKLALTGNAAGAVFRYNTSGYFRFYKDCGQKAVYLYKKVEGGGGTTTYSDYITTCASDIEFVELGDAFKWSAAEAEVTIDATDNVFPTLTNTHNVPVIYSSSDDAIATIADGTVTLKNEGSVTITAKYEGGISAGTGKEYKAKTVTYSLKVNKAAPVASGTTYVKVTSTAGITDGEYLIVYESGKVAFDGSLATLDAISNTIEVEITDGTIAGTNYIDDATFTIDATANTIKSASGYYIGQTSDANGLKANTTTQYENVLTIENDGSATIKSGGAYLRYNSDANQWRFRYYKSSSYSGQKAIALYKKASKHTVTIADCTNGSVSAKMGETALATNDQVLSGIQITLSNEAATGYKLTAYDVYKTGDATTKVTVTDGKFIMPEFDVTISATFELAKTLTGIEITTPATQTTFWQGETFNSTGLVVTAHFDGASDEDVTDKVTVTGSTATSGTQTVTVSFKEGEVTKTTTYNITVKAIPNTKETAYTVADAFDIIDKLTTANGVFIKGIVSQVDEYLSNYKSITYWISDDGTTTKQLQAYSGKGLDGAEFSDINGISVDDQVIICGDLKKYSGTYEFDKNNYLAKHTKTTKADPELSYTTTEYDVNLGDAFTAPTLNNPHTLPVTYSSSNEDVATVATDGAVTIKAAGTVTITASFAGNDDYIAKEASYTINITDPNLLEVTFDATQDLDANNTERGEGKIIKAPITFACTDGILGSSTYGHYRIYANAKATFSAAEGYIITKVVLTSTASNDSQYGPGLLSTEEGYTYSGKEGTWVGEAYTITLTATAQTRATLITVYYKQDNRVDAGLAWNPATVSLTVGDAFTAPTFSNPNRLTVSFESSNTALATVNNAGVVSLVSGKTGSATITATYAGDETYKPAEVTCIITVNPKTEDVVIVAKQGGKWYALKAEDLDGANKTMAALEVEYINGVVYNLSDAEKTAITWERAVIGNQVTFKHGDKYLFGTTGGTDLKLSVDECEWTYNGKSYMIGARTFLYREGANGFKNYNAGTNAGTADYSALPVVTAAKFENATIITRSDLSAGNFGTICYENNITNFTGATFYEVAGKEGRKVIFDEVTELVAGMPYIFRAEAAELKIVLGQENTTTAGQHKSLQGTFEKIEDGEAGEAGNTLEGNYIIYNNFIKKCGAKCGLLENRAYFIADALNNLTAPVSPAPGRKRVSMDVLGENEATGVDNITENGVIAPAMQGTYDVLGRQLSEPTATGFYIVNGKKVFVVK